MWTNNGTPLGGVAKLPSDQAAMGVPPHWISSVEVNNVDETTRKATSLGGKIVMPPMDIPGTGRYSMFSDPQGAVIAVFQPSGPSEGFDGTPKLGRHSWNELMTTDYKRAFDFYRQVLGWEKIAEIDMGGGMVYLEFGKNGKMYGGMYNRLPEMVGVPPFWLPYINVQDAKKSTEIAKRAGATVVNGPMEIPGGGWITVMADPQGAAFAVHSVARAAPSASKPKVAAKSKAGGKRQPAKRKAASKRATPKKQAKSRTKAKKRSKARPKSRPKSRPRAKAKKKARRR
jgi:predicted enzyme related to lactoylglutathione lyase